MRLLRRFGRRRARPPAPFVVGVPRSGTTLLRLMLDAHPDLAIPPETGVGLVADHLLREQPSPAETTDLLVRLPTWPDLGFDPAELRALLAATTPWSPGHGLRALFTAYATRHGKPRWGDKTPVHCLHMRSLSELLPEARFVHIIRDGRDVATSVRKRRCGSFATSWGCGSSGECCTRTNEPLSATASCAGGPKTGAPMLRQPPGTTGRCIPRIPRAPDAGGGISTRRTSPVSRPSPGRC